MPEVKLNYIVRQFLLQDLTPLELISYNQYVNGDNSSILWIEKASIRRDQLLTAQLNCHVVSCNGFIGVNEHGECQCLNGHDGYQQVLHLIQNIIN